VTIFLREPGWFGASLQLMPSKQPGSGGPASVAGGAQRLGGISVHRALRNVAGKSQRPADEEDLHGLIKGADSLGSLCSLVPRRFLGHPRRDSESGAGGLGSADF